MQEKKAEKMIKKHGHKRKKKTIEIKEKDMVRIPKPLKSINTFGIFNISGFFQITIALPRIDLAGTDLPRAPWAILRVIKAHNEVFYEVVTFHGILNDKYRAFDLNLFNGGFLDFNPNKINNHISLTSAEKSKSKCCQNVPKNQTKKLEKKWFFYIIFLE